MSKCIFFFRSLLDILWVKIFPFIMLSFILVACSNESPPKVSAEDAIVAQIGDQKITVRDFRRSYETALGHLKIGADGKRTYLDYMIKEKVLALKGYQLGLHDTAWIKAAEAKLLNALLVEELVEVEIKSKIKVNPDEVREAINKSKVSFKFRHWPENNLEKAKEIAADMKERGYAAVVDDQLKKHKEKRINPRQLESDYVTWLDVQPEVLETIKDLPYGDISDPVEINGQFLVFQVLDIRREAVTENEYISKYDSHKEIVFHTKLQKAISKYVVDLMTPKDVVTKANAFNLLNAGIHEWYKKGKGNFPDFLTAVKSATAEYPAFLALKENLQSTFTTYKGGEISVETFLDGFRFSYLKNRDPQKQGTVEGVKEAVALTIRDIFLRKTAREKDLQASPQVQQELALWQNKWVYEEARKQFTENVKTDEEKAKQYFEQFKQRYTLQKDEPPVFEKSKDIFTADARRYYNNLSLSQKADSLANVYSVKVYTEILDTIQVIDFKKSKWASMQILVGGTNRTAYPAVDPKWGSIR